MGADGRLRASRTGGTNREAEVIASCERQIEWPSTGDQRPFFHCAAGTIVRKVSLIEIVDTGRSAFRVTIIGRFSSSWRRRYGQWRRPVQAGLTISSLFRGTAARRRE